MGAGVSGKKEWEIGAEATSAASRNENKACPHANVDPVTFRLEGSRQHGDNVTLRNGKGAVFADIQVTVDFIAVR